MSEQTWTWDQRSHPWVMDAFASPADNLSWCGRLETAAADPVTGKVLCVCAAAAIAREVLATSSSDTRQAQDALDLLRDWINDPTNERFEQICAIIFPEGELPDLGPQGVVWWALRTATSSVDNFEAGWALESTCGAAEDSGFSPEQMRSIAEREVLAWRLMPQPA